MSERETKELLYRYTSIDPRDNVTAYKLVILQRKLLFELITALLSGYGITLYHSIRTCDIPHQ
jgi:hypothetical protein